MEGDGLSKQLGEGRYICLPASLHSLSKYLQRQ